MSKTLIVVIVLGVCALLFGGSMILWGMGTYNTCIEHETNIEAQYKDNKNVLSNYTKKIMEMAQVPAMAKDDLKETIEAAITGRYGKNGSTAVFQFIKEQNPTVDSKLYVNLQQAMESGRDKFEATQRMLLDKCRIYTTYVKGMPTSMVAGMFGFPKIRLEGDDSMCTPVTDNRTEKAFETKREEAIQLR